MSAPEKQRTVGVTGRTPPPLRARGNFQCLVGNSVGEDIFVSLVEGGSGGAGIVHGECSTLPMPRPPVSSKAVVAQAFESEEGSPPCPRQLPVPRRKLCG